MSKFVKYFLLLSFICSCSTMTKNLHLDGELTLSGGRSGTKTWDDELVLKRSSWFKELTMYYDILYTHIDETSPFYNWFSLEEKATLQECVDIIVLSAYAFRPRDISKTMFRMEMAKYGYESFTLNTFEKNIRMHPDYARFQMGVYSTYAFCRKGIKAEKISIEFPGFKEVYLDN